MESDHSYSEARALRRYVEEVAAAVGVEAEAAWYEYGPPSSAYVALADRSANDRFLMLEWNSRTGWSLAVEPDGDEPPVILASWPESIRPRPADVAANVRRTLGVQLSVRVTTDRPLKGCRP